MVLLLERQHPFRECRVGRAVFAGERLHGVVVAGEAGARVEFDALPRARQ